MGANYKEMNYYLTEDLRTRIEDPVLQREVQQVIIKA
jgi:hypothetical protein